MRSNANISPTWFYKKSCTIKRTTTPITNAAGYMHPPVRSATAGSAAGCHTGTNLPTPLTIPSSPSLLVTYLFRKPANALMGFTITASYSSSTYHLFSNILAKPVASFAGPVYRRNLVSPQADTPRISTYTLTPVSTHSVPGAGDTAGTISREEAKTGARNFSRICAVRALCILGMPKNPATARRGPPV